MHRQYNILLNTPSYLNYNPSISKYYDMYINIFIYLFYCNDKIKL